MSSKTIDADAIGLTVDLEDVEIPAVLGRRLQTLYASDEPPTTAAEWIMHVEAAITSERDRKPTVEELCTTDDGDHSFESADGDHRQEYICVLDPIAYPFLTDTVGTIVSKTPIREATVTVDVDWNGIDSSHEDAVVSLGVSDHVDRVDEVTPDAVYQQSCGYIQTFEDEGEYGAWTDTVEAATTPLSLRTGIGVAGGIATTLFE